MMNKIALPLLLLTSLATVYAQDLTFQTPSGNIHCWGDNRGVRCDLLEFSGKPIQPRPRSCDFDWGQAFYVPNNGKASLQCISDTVAGNNPILQYGQTVSGKNWTCTSQSNGLTCRNKANHGFQLSRQKQNLF